MSRKKYYVNLQTNEITSYSVPGNTEYEILANENEVNKIKMLFDNLKQDSKQALAQIVVNYSDESLVDKEREKYGDDLLAIYQQIYNLGTEKTVKEIDRINLLRN